MKLVEILAKKLDAWPTGAAIAVQDGDARKTVKFGSKHANPSIALMGQEDVWQSRDWKYTHESDFDHSVLAYDWKTAIVTKAQWQAERDRQKGGEWKRHRGGKCPVENGVRVECKLRCGDIQQGASDDFLWPHAYCDVAANIMQYRVISKPQAEEVEYRGPFLAAPIADSETALEYDIEFPSGVCSVEANPDYSAGQWHQIDGPIKWRDTVNELDAYIEEFTREREALINRLAEEGFALIPPVVSVMSQFEGVDMGDWRNWEYDDVVECISVPMKHGGYYTEGQLYKIKSVDRDDQGSSTEVDVVSDREITLWCPASSFKFIRRP